MFRHVVLFTWKDDATEAQKQALHDGLAKLPPAIDTIRAYKFGPDAGLNPANCDYALVADFGDQAGGTITITNVGVFGVDAGTPILTPGEAAILAFGQVKDAPWVHEGALAVRQVTTLALSFDHRIVDGDLGSAFLRDVGAMLTDPVRMLAWS